MRKLMVIIQGDFVAPRFDLATEVLIVRFEKNNTVGEPKMIIRERSSDEALCQMAVEEQITDIICGGIEEVHFYFLVWKKIKVFDAFIGSWQIALEKCIAGTLQQGEIIIPEKDERLTL